MRRQPGSYNQHDGPRPASSSSSSASSSCRWPPTRSGGRCATTSRRIGAAADWSSAKLLPEPAEAPEALVADLAARVGRWRGIFAHHSWVVVKEAGARRYTRYDKVGWGSPVRTDGWPPDGRWFGNVPQPDRGHRAARRRSALIPQIRAAVASYPYRGSRRLPGLAGAELATPSSPTSCAPVPELARRPAADRHRQGLAARRRHRRPDAEPHRHPGLARRLCGPLGRLGRGDRGQFPRPHRRASTCAARPSSSRAGAGSASSRSIW